MAYRGGMMNHGPLNPPAVANSPSGTSAGAGSSSGSQVEGLFHPLLPHVFVIFTIPLWVYSIADMYSLFFCTQSLTSQE